MVGFAAVGVNVGALRANFGRSCTARWRVLSVLLAAVTCSPISHAQDGPALLDVQTFQPTAGPGTTFQIDRPEVLRHRTFVVGAAGNYAYGLLERDDAMGRSTRVVPHRGQLELSMALGLFERLQLSIAVPLVVARTLRDPMGAAADAVTRAGPGDVRVGLKFPILRGRFALSGQVLSSLPTARVGVLGGQGHWTVRPSLIFAYSRRALRLTTEVGWLFRDRHAIGGLEVDDELHILAGGSWFIVPQLAIIGEVNARLGLAGRTRALAEMPMEADVGVRFHPSTAVTVDLGGGTGIVAGYGAPLARGFVVVRYTNETEPCAAGPEDFDGYQDGDFCADLDNDGDGLPDTRDECPNDTEDLDGFLDDDGCAERDNDADGLADDVDQCPLESEDIDGFLDEDGCPELDNDEDGVVDGFDDCPMEPEDLDAFQDEDGCPEPGPRPAVVTITDTRILISERVYFDHDTENIRSVSFPLLDQVAEVIGDLSMSRRIRVEGYSDSTGNDSYNLDLSYRRARAVVEYLVRRGVPEARLSYAGYGEANPVAPNDSSEGQALNRRVEFTIFEPEDAAHDEPAVPAPTAPRHHHRHH